MATTHRALRIEQEENTTALLIDILSAIEVLALLIEDEDEQDALARMLAEAEQLRRAAIRRRNQPYTTPGGA